MNKSIVKVGLSILVIAILFPPVTYTNGANSALNSAFGLSEPSPDVTLRPIWNIDGEYPMTDEEVNTSYLLIEIVLIIALTFGIAYVTDESEKEE